jgi:glucosamine--fructose-6-phosphate aminotransferase (isomerizing)
VVVLDRACAGSIAGIHRLAYDGTDLPVEEDDLATAQITTRDVDRGGHAHYLLKEITQAPQSVRKTLRGKIVDGDHGQLTVTLPSSVLPDRVRTRLGSGEIRRIYAIGQGTAAVAAQSVATSISTALGRAAQRVEAVPATELSGFGMDDDMSDALVVAISQSGTTTDTNRTVDLVRSRGATVIAIVNRRNSDLVEKADGVLYTSDGRDVEMAVPSTKAFYMQVVAGVLLAWALADAAGAVDAEARHQWLSALTRLPDALERVLASRDDIAVAAHRYAPSRRYWAIVGNGANRVAAAELRIKLSELCYKSIACDVTEDKKHVDLSAEPMILVCAAGLSGPNADDVAKEVAIFRAHNAAPIVIASEGEPAFGAALHVLEVPRVHPDLDFVLAAMVGHLFGYEAALAIDAQARGLREARASVEEVVAADGDADRLMAELRPLLVPAAARFFEGLRAGALNGHLEASTAVRLSSLFRFATGTVPVEAYELEYGKVGSPRAVVEDLVDALSGAIDELTRPIDAIKHQAKTVTVGISRAEESYAAVTLVQETLAAGAARDRLSYRSLRTLAALDPAVAEVTGYTRYEVEGDPARAATIGVLDKGGIAADVASRTESDRRLKGTKRRAATEREVTVSRGESDGRTIVIVPEVKDNQVTGLTLLHVDFHGRLAPDAFRAVLSGYRNRYNALVDAVCETEPSFDDSRLGEIDVTDILVEPVRDLARHWRQG